MRLLALLHALFLAGSAGAQWLFDRMGRADGLPDGEVHALLEDRDGFLWAGTSNGLARLEGTRVRVFHHDPIDSASLAHDQVNGIAQASDGTLWFATMDGLSRLHPRTGSFSNQRVVASGADARLANRMQQVLPVGDSLVWVVTEAGLYRFEVRARSFVKVQGRGPGQGPSGLVSAKQALYWDAERAVLWAATTRGIASWSAATDRWTDHRTTDRAPWSDVLSTDAPVVHDHALWFMRSGSFTLMRHDLRTGTSEVQPDVEAQPNRFGLRCQSFDADGRHWLATWTHRLFVQEPSGPWRELLTEGTGLPSTRVNCMLLTRSGERWLGTADGIAVLQRNAMATTVLPFNTAPHIVLSLRQWSADTLLVGTDGGGVHIHDLRRGSTKQLTVHRPDGPEGADLLANMIQGFGPEVDGRLLVCTGYGLLELDKQQETLAPAHRLMDRLPRGWTTTFTFAAQERNALWLGTWSRGLWRVDLEGPDVFLVDTLPGPWGRLPNRKTLCWLVTRDGTPWVGLNDGGGLARMRREGWGSVVDADQANVGGVVRCMAEGPDGRLWLGTHEQGVVVHDPATGANERIGRRQGLPGTRILALDCLRNGAVWLATPQGVAYRPAGAQHFTTFPMPSAFADQEYTAGLLPLTDGRLAIGVGGRVLLHDPAIGSEADPPVPVFTGHRVNDTEALGAPDALTLADDRKALVLELGALGVRPTLVPVFRYRILPSDTVWHEIGAATRLDLFELPPGAHVVEVQVSTDGAQWSPASAKAQVEVLPPFHATWWFRTGVLLLVLFGLFLAFRNYLAGQLRRQREAFEREQAVLAERMRIAEDMHDDLGAGLSALKLRSEMALRVEKDPLKREQLGSLARTAGELIGSMRQIIWTMNADQGTVSDLFAYTTNYARQYCDQNGLDLAVATEGGGAQQQLSAEQRRNIFLVVKEALHNMVKHAAAHRAGLDMVFREGELEVRIADDGPGFPPGLGSSEGNGLRNMRRRVEALGGTLEVGNGLFPGLPGASIGLRVPMAPTNLRSIGRKAVPDNLRA